MTALLDAPPQGETVTEYDRAHLRLYLRLLDAERDGADWREVVVLLLGIDPASAPDRAWQVHDAHLARARWLSARGYRDLSQDRE